MGRDRVAAARHPRCVDRCRGIGAADLATGTRPVVGQRVLRIEIAGSDGSLHRLADHNFPMINRASCGRGHWRGSAEVEHEAGAQARAVECWSPQIRLHRAHFVREIVTGPHVVGFDQSQA